MISHSGFTFISCVFLQRTGVTLSKVGRWKLGEGNTANSALSADVIYSFLIFQTLPLSFTWQFITPLFSCFPSSRYGAWTNKWCACRVCFPNLLSRHGGCFSSPDLTCDIKWMLCCIVLIQKAHYWELNWQEWAFVLFCLETMSQSGPSVKIQYSKYRGGVGRLLAAPKKIQLRCTQRMRAFFFRRLASRLKIKYIMTCRKLCEK